MALGCAASHAGLAGPIDGVPRKLALEQTMYRDAKGIRSISGSIGVVRRAPGSINGLRIRRFLRLH